MEKWWQKVELFSKLSPPHQHCVVSLYLYPQGCQYFQHLYTVPSPPRDKSVLAAPVKSNPQSFQPDTYPGVYPVRHLRLLRPQCCDGDLLAQSEECLLKDRCIV